MTLASEDTKSMLLDQSLTKLTAKVDSLDITCNSLMTISIDPNILNFYRTQVDMYRHLSLIGVGSLHFILLLGGDFLPFLYHFSVSVLNV